MWDIKRFLFVKCQGNQLKDWTNRVALLKHMKKLIHLIWNFRLPQRCSWSPCPSAKLYTVDLYLATDVSGQPIDPIFTGISVQDFLLGCDETSLTCCQPTPRNISEEWRLLAHCTRVNWRMMSKVIPIFEWKYSKHIKPGCWLTSPRRRCSAGVTEVKLGSSVQAEGFL